MPTTSAIGCSTDTDLKHEQFERLMQWHVKMCAGIWKRWGLPYQYIDTNAGSGRYQKDGKKYVGSPLRALPALHQHLHIYHAFLCEIDPSRCDTLADEVAQLAAAGQTSQLRVEIGRGDQDTEVPTYCARVPVNSLGLLFHDPNGTPNVALLSQLSQLPSMAKIDFLLYVPATAIKRSRGAGHSDKYLVDHISLIQKRYWLVRRPAGRWQWTFLLGTNWKDFKEWRREGFYRLDSPEGQAVLEKLNLSKPEQQANHQLALGFAHA